MPIHAGAAAPYLSLAFSFSIHSHTSPFHSRSPPLHSAPFRSDLTVRHGSRSLATAYPSAAIYNIALLLRRILFTAALFPAFPNQLLRYHRCLALTFTIFAISHSWPNKCPRNVCRMKRKNFFSVLFYPDIRTEGKGD